MVKKMSGEKRVSEMTSVEIKDAVRRTYAQVAIRGKDILSTQKGPVSSCCGPSKSETETKLESMGYPLEGLTAEAMESYAGCGNPIALAELKKGEVVLDLGSGAGLDAFVAAKNVGSDGFVIGVDMTDEMLESANSSARKLGLTNVEFRKGDIEDLPVDDESVDVIISNCVINLSTDKQRVFQEVYRVLKPGGRMMVSDIVLQNDISQELRDDVSTYTGCLGGAILEKEYLACISKAGFADIDVRSRASFDLGSSVRISAKKPF